MKVDCGKQGASVSHMMAARVWDVVSRLPGCSGQASDAVSPKTQVKMEDAAEVPHLSEEELSKDLDQNTESKRTTTLGLNCRSSSTAGAQSVRSPTGLDSEGRTFEKVLIEEGWDKAPGCE